MFEKQEVYNSKYNIIINTPWRHRDTKHIFFPSNWLDVNMFFCCHFYKTKYLCCRGNFLVLFFFISVFGKALMNYSYFLSFFYFEDILFIRKSDKYIKSIPGNIIQFDLNIYCQIFKLESFVSLMIIVDSRHIS